MGLIVEALGSSLGLKFSLVNPKPLTLFGSGALGLDARLLRVQGYSVPRDLWAIAYTSV